MSEKSNIAWTDSTHNFWRGCTKVSPGCAHCYAETLVTTRLKGQWGKGAPRIISKDFDAPLRWNRKPWVCDACGLYHKDKPSRCGNHIELPEQMCTCESKNFHRRSVFSLSLGDWLDPEVPIEWLADMLDVIRRCDQLQWILCTKRAELWESRTRAARNWLTTNGDANTAIWLNDWLPHCETPGMPASPGRPPANVCLLVSVENQEMADKRIPELLKIPAAKRGLSCEPLLGPLDLPALRINQSGINAPGIDWVIVGGESGPKARRCKTQWIRNIRDQCKSAQVSCFIKQLGSKPTQDLDDDPHDETHNAPLLLKHRSGADPSEWPDDLCIQQFPFHA